MSSGLSSEGRSVRALATQAVARGEALWRADFPGRARWLGQAFAMLGSPRSKLGQRARAEIPKSSGLSEPMVSWALETSLAGLTEAHLLELARSVHPPHPGARLVRPGHLCALILAGNVFTAAARGAALPLLFGWPVLAKASSDDDVFARLLKDALDESAPELADAFAVVTFAGDEAHHTTALLEQADAVVAFGSDRTLNEIRANLGATVSFVPHGHGLGAAFVDTPALASLESAQEVARGLALDVAAYDQRGCLSPLVAWVVEGGKVGLEAFAELVFAELDALRANLPRGTLPIEVASAQLSWRGVGAMRGRLFEGDGFAVSCEEHGLLRLSPGYRNLQILGLEQAAQLPAKLAPLGVHLKTLGVSGVADREALVRSLPARVAPRVCGVGTMQTPPVHALHDGLPAWEGLLRWAET
jgi:hypothetical protein